MINASNPPILYLVLKPHQKWSQWKLAVKKLSIREKNREKRLGYAKLDKTRLKIGTGLFRRLG